MNTPKVRLRGNLKVQKQKEDEEGSKQSNKKAQARFKGYDAATGKVVIRIEGKQEGVEFWFEPSFDFAQLKQMVKKEDLAHVVSEVLHNMDDEYEEDDEDREESI